MMLTREQVQKIKSKAENGLQQIAEGRVHPSLVSDLRECWQNEIQLADLALERLAMQTLSFIEVVADDWAGLYIDGKLFCEGHRVTKSEMAEASAGRPFVYECIEVQQAWIEGLGSLPEQFSEIPSSSLPKVST